ncbi:MAG: hypothetical protein Q9217_006926, partial [Psora testacea]
MDASSLTQILSSSSIAGSHAHALLLFDPGPRPDTQKSQASHKQWVQSLIDVQKENCERAELLGRLRNLRQSQFTREMQLLALQQEACEEALEEARQKLSSVLPLPDIHEDGLSPSYGPLAPSRFRDALVSRLGDKDYTTGTLLFHGCQDKIFIYSHAQTQYTLMTSDEVFDYSELEGLGLPEDLANNNTDSSSKASDSASLADSPFPYWRLRRADQRYFNALKSNEPNAEEGSWEVADGDIFLALGWLVERNPSGFHRATKYVCMLNLSTTPVSMWLVFDYRQPNRHSLLEAPQVPDFQTSYNSPYFDHFHGSASCLEPQDSCLKSESLLKQQGGYMDAPEPWDIALVYKDIKDWPSAAPNTSSSTLRPSTNRKPYGKLDTNLRAVRTDPPQTFFDRLKNPPTPSDSQPLTCEDDQK